MRKSAAFYLLSLVSFCFFTVLFQTVASAQSQNPPPHSQNKIITRPTPTVFIMPTAIPTPLPTSTPTEVPLPTDPPATPAPAVISAPDDLNSLFNTYANEYNVNANELKKIANCESGFNAGSNYQGVYVGMFQFAQETWINERTQMGADTNPALRTNAGESIKTAAFMLAHGQQDSWPSCN